jgi:hypothetical protein
MLTIQRLEQVNALSRRQNQCQHNPIQKAINKRTIHTRPSESMHIGTRLIPDSVYPLPNPIDPIRIESGLGQSTPHSSWFRTGLICICIVDEYGAVGWRVREIKESFI